MQKSNKFILCHLFKLDGLYYIYVLKKGITIEVPFQTYLSVQKYLNAEKLNKNERKIIALLLDSGIFDVEKDSLGKKRESKERYKEAYLSFAPKYQCNFKCKYCFGEFGKKYCGEPREFSEENVRRMLHYFFEIAFPEADNYRIDFVSGGEPLLGLDIIKQTISEIEKICEKTKKRVSIWLCTNGSLLNEEICKYLDSHNISIGVSLDGIKEIHDSNRVYSSDKGTYDDVIKNIFKVLQSSHLSKRFRNIWTLSVATNENKNIIDIIEHHYNLGIRNMQIKLVRERTELDVKEFIVSYTNLRKFLYEKYISGQYDYIYAILNDNDQFGKILKRVMLNEMVERRCNAGKNKITVCPDGTVYPCDSFVGIRDFIIGDVEQSTICSEAFNKVDIYDRDQCKYCSLRYLCGGDCYYNSYIHTGSILKPSSDFCIIQKSIIENSIVLCYQMEKYNSEIYASFIRRVMIKNEYIRIR